MDKNARLAPAGLYELWQYRELLYFLARRDLTLRYQQTALGILWAVLQPFGAMVVFSLLFGNLLKLPTDGLPSPLFYYAALLPWNYFAFTLTQAGNSLVSNAHLIRKVYFPRALLPAVPALVGLVDLLIGLVVLLGLMLYYNVSFTWKVVLWPLLAFPLGLLALAIGLFLAVINVQYCDVKYVAPFLVQLLLFVTPIIYPATIVPPRFWPLVAVNPLAGLIKAFRSTCLPERSLDWALLGSSLAITALLLLGSIMYFHSVDGDLSDRV